MGSNDRLERLADELAIRDLRSRYAHAVDGEDWNGFADLLTEDAVGVYGSGTMTGRDAVVEYTRENASYEYSMHTALMPAIEIDGDTGTGKWYMAHYYLLPDGTRGWHFGTYDDEYRRVDGEWKFSRIEVEVTDAPRSTPGE